jgi:hypothetical protein
LCEIACGLAGHRNLHANVHPLDIPVTDEALAVWNEWHARTATLCYDSTYGVGIASGRTPAAAEPILGLWVRQLWLCLEDLGWRLHVRHVKGHSGDYYNDMADAWADAGCTVPGVRAAWVVREPAAAIAWGDPGPAVVHPLRAHRVRGLETSLMRCLRASLQEIRWVPWVREKIQRWNPDWTILTMRGVIGTVRHLPARVVMATLTLWVNAWTTAMRIRFFAPDGTPQRCRFCGEAEDRVEHYFGVGLPPCEAIARAAAANLRSDAPTMTEWFGIFPLPLTATTLATATDLARLRFYLRRALHVVPPGAAIGADWLQRWFVSARPLAVSRQRTRGRIRAAAAEAGGAGPPPAPPARPPPPTAHLPPLPRAPPSTPSPGVPALPSPATPLAIPLVLTAPTTPTSRRARKRGASPPAQRMATPPEGTPQSRLARVFARNTRARLHGSSHTRPFSPTRAQTARAHKRSRSESRSLTPPTRAQFAARRNQKLRLNPLPPRVDLT